jgi:hypothetical protein
MGRTVMTIFECDRCKFSIIEGGVWLPDKWELWYTGEEAADSPSVLCPACANKIREEE